MHGWNDTASCPSINSILKPAGKAPVKVLSIGKLQRNMKGETVINLGGIEKKPGNWRYKMTLPPIDLNFHHDFQLFCPNRRLWRDIRWGRLGAGGHVDARHCFVDDYRLEHLWRRPGQGLVKAIDAATITAPDFTIDESFPAELVQYQVWRSRVLAAYWQEYGVTVIPVLQWGCPESFPLCARGIAQGSVVAVRGPQRGTESKWVIGAQYMLDRIQPQLVLHFGRKSDVWPKALYFPLRSTKALSAAGCTKSGTE